MMTVGEAAAFLAGDDPVENRAYLARQIRSLIAHGLLGHLPKKGHGVTRASLLDENKIAIAAILGEMTRIGLVRPLLLAASKRLNQPSEAMRIVLRGLRAGERWFLVVRQEEEPEAILTRSTETVTDYGPIIVIIDLASILWKLVPPSEILVAA